MHVDGENIMNENVSLTKNCRDTEQLEIFDAIPLQQMIQFKWEKYGKIPHMLGCFMHIFSCMIMILYVKNSYIEEAENQILYACLLAVGIIYPSLYDFS